MDELKYKAAVGSILYNIEKLFVLAQKRHYTGDGSQSLLNGAETADDELLQIIKLADEENLKIQNIPDDGLAAVIIAADDIARAADKCGEYPKLNDSSDELCLYSIFNNLNGNRGSQRFSAEALTEKINFPADKTEFDARYYSECFNKVKKALNSYAPTKEFLNAFSNITELYFSYLPYQTQSGAATDISLFIHSKIAAATALNILDYAASLGITDYRKSFIENKDDFYDKKAFLLYSIDISGIQDFIYNIVSRGALKALRARSFYLELLMEQMVDNALDTVGSTRLNCVYSGGGHAYLLLPNTPDVKRGIKDFESQTNGWLLNTFGISLYLAGGYAECSANDLSDIPKGSYKKVFREVSNGLSASKTHRYSANQINDLLNSAAKDALRECTVCRRTENLSSGEKCSICEGLESLSKYLLKGSFFAVTKSRTKNSILPLPGNAYLTAETPESLSVMLKSDPGFIRCYSKNKFSEDGGAACVWAADYKYGEDFEDLADEAEGIRRLAVIRADIDNLGQAFVSGFENDKGGCVSLARTAAFSKSLSLFFKRHINDILKHGEYFLTGRDDKKRRAAVVYSGGDDVFVIGAWDDIIGFAVDLDNALNKYTQGTLTISAGIGLYPEKYPVSAMARQTGELEELSKSLPGKNAVTVFGEGNTYSWQCFIDSVLNEKYRIIKEFFSSVPGYGKSFIYRLLELMRARNEKINIARYAYILARMQPNSNEDKERYNEFAERMYKWILDGEQCAQAITAFYIYLYTIREGGNSDGVEQAELR